MCAATMARGADGSPSLTTSRFPSASSRAPASPRARRRMERTSASPPGGPKASLSSLKSSSLESATVPPLYFGGAEFDREVGDKRHSRLDVGEVHHLTSA